MKEKPILFSTDMVRAILEGRKTQTRRVVKEPMQQWMLTATNKKWWEFIEEQCPYGQPGDVLWVRESILNQPHKVTTIYRAQVCSQHDKPDNTKWRPSIHMPKAAARIWLQIESISVERVQDITEEDAKREGVEPLVDGLYSHYYQPELPAQTARESFRTLWQHINGPESWAANSWVWVIQFKVLSTTGKPNNLITQ